MEQEEIALRVRREHQETETTETIATETPDYATTPDTQEEHRGEEEPRVSPAEKQQQEDTSPELDALSYRILEIIKQKERVGLPSLKSCDRTKLKAEVGKVNEAVKRIQTRNITELNSLMYAAAYVTTDRMGMIKGRKGRRTEEPFWKRRIKRNIETWRKDLSKIEEVRKGNMRLKQRERERLNRKYQLEERGTLYASGMLKQKIKAGGVKVKRYDDRCQQFKQNQLFNTNQKLFYETLDDKKPGETVLPPTETTSFWNNIWSEEVGYNESASWLEDIEVAFSTTEVQEDINITMEDISPWGALQVPGVLCKSLGCSPSPWGERALRALRR